MQAMLDGLLGCVTGADGDGNPGVRISLGRIVGKARETSAGTEFISFTRVPYAKPPTGRFRSATQRTCGSTRVGRGFASCSAAGHNT